MPRFILYMDGRLLVREWELFDDPKMNTQHYQETTLTSTEMCALLQAVQATGVLTVEGGGGYTYAQDDPIYEFGDFNNFSEGAPFNFITVNGPVPKQVRVYVFLEAGEAYWVLVRQLLPHENPDDIPSFIGEPQRRPLPFDCSL